MILRHMIPCPVNVSVIFMNVWVSCEPMGWRELNCIRNAWAQFRALTQLGISCIWQAEDSKRRENSEFLIGITRNLQSRATWSPRQQRWVTSSFAAIQNSHPHSGKKLLIYEPSMLQISTLHGSESSACCQLSSSHSCQRETVVGRYHLP
jgi:hypothetical protein